MIINITPHNGASISALNEYGMPVWINGVMQTEAVFIPADDLYRFRYNGFWYRVAACDATIIKHAWED